MVSERAVAIPCCAGKEMFIGVKEVIPFTLAKVISGCSASDLAKKDTSEETERDATTRVRVITRSFIGGGGSKDFLTFT